MKMDRVECKRIGLSHLQEHEAKCTPQVEGRRLAKARMKLRSENGAELVMRNLEA